MILPALNRYLTEAFSYLLQFFLELQLLSVLNYDYLITFKSVTAVLTKNISAQRTYIRYYFLSKVMTIYIIEEFEIVYIN
jgi:hypothetical protein